MIRALFVALFVILGMSGSFAQAPPSVKICVQSGATCVPVTSGSPLPVNATTTVAPFTPGASGSRATPLTVTTSDSSGNLPTNTGSVIVTNVSTNPMYCNVAGVAATTSDQLITSSGGWFDFGIANGVTTLHCIATGGSTTANMVGGSGLGAGTGGGSGGGGGGGAVTIADGADVTQGAKADSVCGTATGTCSVTALVKFLNSAVTSAIPAGTNNIGSIVPAVATSGGITTFFVQPAASDNHTNIKNGAGQVYYVLAMNNSATVNYLRFYNAASGFNGCNSATGLITQIQIPASTSVGGVSIPLPFPIPFSTGISICVTSGYATNDTTNATATAMSLTIGYD